MFGVCSVQKSQLPFSASTGNYGVPAKESNRESNVGNGQGDTIAPMRDACGGMASGGIPIRGPKGVGRTRTLPEMTLVRRSNTRPSLLPLNKKQQVYCPNKKQCCKGLSRK